MQKKFMKNLEEAFTEANSLGMDLNNPEVLNRLFDTSSFRVEYRSYDPATEILHGYAIIDCAKVKFTEDWQQIRGARIATVFQDPMTSLNPVITIGQQIMTVILKHQKCSNAEARERTIDIMRKVGIPDPESRFDDYPFEYSGGMRQRIVIAIALSCQPKILICDEPTTALDVTIQAQIIRLIKDLQKELGFTTVFITHDLGVVANIAERVAVLYGGQIIELGTVEDVFYDPRHPYTWALLSSLPQLSEKGTDLFSIPGTPPSLYNKIVGDAFAPRSQYAMAIDLKEEPPMFQVSDTHFAKTWLLDPRAPKVEIPKNIQNLHEKMLKTYVDFDAEGGTDGQ
ncbi:MAG: ABC transporter ATP-binding protein [Erysipelotrichaceae bacterium]|nr:ABC transporter ATP-binding protein [Erysipelotrichaceae bacterium]